MAKKKTVEEVKEPKITVETLKSGVIGQLEDIVINGKSVFCKHQNQGDGKCFDCGQII